MAGINHERVVASKDKGLFSDWNADHKQKGDHDCEQHQHLNHVWENRNDWPAGPVVGQVVYRTDFNNFFGWNGTGWQSLTPVATVVVAADGTGNYLTIQEGVDALPATGGVIYVKEGTYTSATRITINKDTVSIKGAGHGTIITNSLGDVHLIEVAVNTDYFTIEDVLFKPTVALGGLGAVVIFLGATTKSRISNCWFDDWEPRGVSFGGAGEGIIVENCVFEAIAGGGPNYAILVNHSSYGYLRGNFVYGGTNCYGIQLAGGIIHHMSILDNKIYNCEAGITVAGVGEEVVVGNTLAGFTYGIWLTNARNTTITGNYLESGTVGILLNANSDYNVIGNNRVNDCDWGIILNAAAEDKNIVVANGLVGNTNALLDNGTATEVAHNTS